MVVLIFLSCPFYLFFLLVLTGFGINLVAVPFVSVCQGAVAWLFGCCSRFRVGVPVASFFLFVKTWGFGAERPGAFSGFRA